MTLTDEERDYIGLVAREAAMVAVKEVAIDVGKMKTSIEVVKTKLRMFWYLGGVVAALAIERTINFFMGE